MTASDEASKLEAALERCRVDPSFDVIAELRRATTDADAQPYSMNSAHVGMRSSIEPTR